jgi:hypothetical protein
MAAESLLSPAYRDGVYVPAALIIVGTFVVKRDWLPYAVLVAIALGSWKFYSMRTSRYLPPDRTVSTLTTRLSASQNQRRCSGPTCSKNSS